MNKHPIKTLTDRLKENGSLLDRIKDQKEQVYCPWYVIGYPTDAAAETPQTAELKRYIDNGLAAMVQDGNDWLKEYIEAEALRQYDPLASGRDFFTFKASTAMAYLMTREVAGKELGAIGDRTLPDKEAMRTAPEAFMQDPLYRFAFELGKKQLWKPAYEGSKLVYDALNFALGGGQKMIGLTLVACLAGWFASKGFGKLEERLFPMYSQPYSASRAANPHAHQEEPERAALNPTPGIDAEAEKQYMLTQMGDMPKELKELILAQAQYRVNINELTEHPGVFYSAHHFMLGAAHAWEDWMKKCKEYPGLDHPISGKEISDYLTGVCNPGIEDVPDLAGAKYLPPQKSIDSMYTVERDARLFARLGDELQDAAYFGKSPLIMDPGNGAEGFTLRPFNGDTDHAEWLNGYFLITRIAGLEDPAAASQQEG